MRNIQEMKDILATELKHKTDFENTELLSSVLISVMCEVFAGDTLYIPMFKAGKAHSKLRDKFNGKNHHELAREFGYSTRTVYSILKNDKPMQKTIT